MQSTKQPMTSSRKKAPNSSADPLHSGNGAVGDPGRTTKSNADSVIPEPVAAASADHTAPRPEPNSNGTQPKPGQNAARQAFEQRIAKEADAIRNDLFPAIMANALGFDHGVEDAAAVKAYLERLVADAADPSDCVERMMLEQIGFAHFRIARLHRAAADAQQCDATKAYSAAASRLLAEFRRLVLALNVYRGKTPKAKVDVELKVAKTA